MAVLCTTAAIAQSKVPAKVKSAFETSYSKATQIKWDKEQGNYEASFVLNGVHMSVLLNPEGKIEETETAIDKSKLPARAREFAEKKGAIKEAALIVKADGSKMYEAEVNGKDLLFDLNGQFLKEAKD